MSAPSLESLVAGEREHGTHGNDTHSHLDLPGRGRRVFCLPEPQSSQL